jgi:hypothetical protein
MEKQNYLVCWLKESARAVCFLHSDRKFYRDFISCRGCNLVTYKTRAAAEKKAQTWKSCKDGRVIAVAADDVERLEQKARENFRRLLFSYEENDTLPAFEDAQPDANGVIKCATRSAASISAGARRFDALFLKDALDQIHLVLRRQDAVTISFYVDLINPHMLLKKRQFALQLLLIGMFGAECNEVHGQFKVSVIPHVVPFLSFSRRHRSNRHLRLHRSLRSLRFLRSHRSLRFLHLLLH